MIIKFLDFIIACIGFCSLLVTFASSLYQYQTWPLTSPDLKCLRRNDRAMIRQISDVKPENVATVKSNELLARLEIDDLDVILREKSLRWVGHIERSSRAIKTVCDMQIDGKRGPG